MPTPTVRAGLGTLLQHGTSGGSPVYTTVALRVSIEGPDGKVGTAPATHLDSTCMTDRPTLPDPGDLSLELFYDPAEASHTLLETLWHTPTIEPWRLLFVDGTKYDFLGFLTGWKLNGMEVESNLGGSVKIRLTSMPVKTAPAA